MCKLNNLIYLLDSKERCVVVIRSVLPCKPSRAVWVPVRSRAMLYAEAARDGGGFYSEGDGVIVLLSSVSVK